jgi:hypothetical protein
VKPTAIDDPEMAEMLKKGYHILACLAYIHQVKACPFHEHSNQHWDISGIPNWPKVYSGRMKMYKAEVLCKYPIMQHSLFGSIFTLEKALPPSPPNHHPGPSRDDAATAMRFPRPSLGADTSFLRALSHRDPTRFPGSKTRLPGRGQDFQALLARLTDLQGPTELIRSFYGPQRGYKIFRTLES